jgi:NADH:ubiquinone oxidoreductase subunit 3 (subunit A)
MNVPNHLVWSILSTLFCCIPFGIVAIVFSAQVDTKLKQKDYEGAKRASSSAKTWNWVSFLTGILTYVIFIVIAIVGLVNSGKW